MKWQEYENCAKEEYQRVDYKMAFVDMVEDQQAGLLLNQIVYWHLPDSKGKSKLRVYKKGNYWIAKARYGWWGETRLSPKQIDRAMGILRDAGIIETMVARFDGIPTTHIRLLKQVFIRKYEKIISAPRENPFLPGASSPKVTDEIAQRDISPTETTTETTIIPVEGVPSTAPGGIPFSDPWEKPPEKISVVVKKPRRPRDPRLSHPAIRAVKEAKDSVRNPSKGTWDILIKTIGDNPDAVKLKQCWTEWCVRGYNTASYKWVTDWYVDGIKGKMAKQENVGNWRLEW